MPSAEDQAAVAILVYRLLTEIGVPPPAPATLIEIVDDAFEPIRASGRASGSAGFGDLGHFGSFVDTARTLIEAVIVTLHVKEISHALGPKVVDLMRRAAAAMPSPRGPELVLVVLNGISEASLSLPSNTREDLALTLEAKIAELKNCEGSEALSKLMVDLTHLVDYLRVANTKLVDGKRGSGLDS